MSTDTTAAERQQKAKEFMSLLPLTLAIAGLSEAAPGTHYSESQLASRAITVKQAYRVARELLLEIVQ